MRKLILIVFALATVMNLNGQSPSFKTYMNPVIPGDHPDCTVTKVGKDYYTTGSPPISFTGKPLLNLSAHRGQASGITREVVAGAGTLFITTANGGITFRGQTPCIL